MNQKIITFAICFIILINTSFSQSKEFYLAPQIGLLNGKNHVNGMVGLTGGVANKHWVYGVGTSIDYYKFRSVPVFAEAKRMFGDKKQQPFMYANAGLNIPWVLDNQRQYYYADWIWGTPQPTPSPSNFATGYLLEAGAGVNIKNKNGKGFFLSLGYSSKSLKESWLSNVWDPGKTEYIIISRSNNYSLNRIVLKIGFRLF